MLTTAIPDNGLSLSYIIRSRTAMEATAELLVYFCRSLMHSSRILLHSSREPGELSQ